MQLQKDNMRVYLVALIIIFIFTIIVDLWLWFTARSFYPRLKGNIKAIVLSLYALVPLCFFALFLYYARHIGQDGVDQDNYYHFTMVNGIYLSIYIPKILMAIFFSISKTFTPSQEPKRKRSIKGIKITRAQFLGRMGAIVGALPFLAIMQGITKGRFNFTVIHEQVKIKHLPSALIGLRIIQLSDIHLGNFKSHYDLLDEVIDNINALKADLIFITGDLVNNFASETEGWENVLSKLKAQYGKYAVLGNHDYGDYSEWKSEKLKINNFNKIKQAYQDSGFQLLLNENKTLHIKGEELSLIGVENWGHPPFPRYGNLKQAMQGQLAKTKILLSHDPDHWEAEVLNHTDIDLTLAGHTHGMQVGLNFKNKQWSPAKWKYKYWGGLYTINHQHIYVNRGLGYVGIPMRVGMPPEISLLTLSQT